MERRTRKSDDVSESILVSIDKIEVGVRHRRELGDLTDLMNSIEDVGLLHPIVLTDSYELVAGQRRLEAVKKLGHLDIEARILPLSTSDLLRAEHDENVVRLDFTPSEKVAIGRALETEVARQAKERMNLGPNATGSTQPKTREIVGKAAGMSGNTYDRAKKVVEAAEADPEKFGDLVEKMDQTGNVSGTLRELKERQAQDAPGPKPRMMPIAPGGQIVQNISHSLHAAVAALDKVVVNGASKEEVAGWIGDLEDPLRRIRQKLRSWKERV